MASAVLDCAPRAASDGARTLQILATEIPTHLDPYEDQRIPSLQVYANVYESLVRVGAGPGPEPALAESWHSPSAEETVFRLRENVHFHDGSPLDAAAVVESLERARRSRFVSGHFADMAEIRALDARTVSLHTRSPTAVLVLGLTGVMITRSGGAGLVGTGPYRVESFVPGESVRLVRFRGYQGHAPYLDEVVFRRYQGESQALGLLRSRPRSLIAPAPPAVVARAAADGNLRVAVRPTRILHYLAFGLHGPPTEPIRDRRVRRAVRMALDLPALVQAASPAGGEPASQLVPRGTIGFDPSLVVPPRDVEAAKALLAEAGHPDGLDLPLDVRAKNVEIATAVARQLDEAGIRVEVRVRPVEEFARRIEGASPFFLYNWVVGQEAGSALRNFLHTRDPRRSLGLQNRTGYTNVEVDDLLQESGGPLSPAGRVALQQRVMRILMEDLPWIPLFIPNERVVQPADLEFPSRLDELLLLSDVRPPLAR
jgi:peptide/nickel transport system substrate-binding protein